MGNLKYSSGKVTITMSDTLDRLVRRALDKAHPGLVERITSDTKAIHLEAEAKWPVRTGKSRAGLTHEVVVSDRGVRGRISNPVDYAFYVRPKEFFGARTAWSTWVQRPMRKLGTKLAKDLGKQIRKHLEGK